MSSLTSVGPKLTCYHCGDVCPDKSIQSEDKYFCCIGCKNVFELLDQKDLCNYYDLDKNPGIKIKSTSKEKYYFLDSEEVVQSLLDFNDGTIAKIKLYIPKIHCSSCIYLLENMHKLNPGVISARVNFGKKEVYVIYNTTQTSLRAIAELMDTIGYTPHIQQKNQDNTKQTSTEDRQLIYKIGVAGFCAGNIMLLSFPEYFGIEELSELKYKYFFAWLNFILALPVLLYAASDYFISAFKALRAKSVNIDLPIATGVIALFSRSAYEVITNTGPGYFDSFTGLLFFLLIGRWFQSKTYSALSFERDYQSFFPVAVLAIREGKEVPLPIAQLVSGDEILIRNHEIVPADAVLLDGKAAIDYSFVTGESTPVHVHTGNMIYAGGRQTDGAIRLQIQKNVSASKLLELWNQDLYQKEKPGKLSTFISKFSTLFIIGVILTALSTFIYWWFNDQSLVWNALVAVLVVACPCAFALAAPFALGIALRALGRKGLYLKNVDTLEKIAYVQDIIFDKTGTLTEAENSFAEFYGDPLDANETLYIKSAVRLSTHPLSKIIYKTLPSDWIDVDAFKEIPSAGIEITVRGQQIKLGSSSFIGQVQNFTTNESQVHVSINGAYRGYFKIRNKYREGIVDTLNELSQNYRLHILSGDNDSEKSFLKQFISDENLLHFKQSPKDKLEYVQKLKASGRHVMMMGDGLNDSGALKQAHVGITVSEDVYNFSPACDAIMEANHWREISSFLKFSKAIINLVRWSILFAVAYNIVGMYFACQAKFTPLVAAILMPVSSVLVVLLVTFFAQRLVKKYLN